MRSRQIIVIAAGIGLGSLFLWLALRNADLAQAKTLLLHEIDYRVGAVVVAVGALYYWCKAFRWQFLLQPIRHVEVRKLLAPVIIGYAGNVLIPAQMGEIARVMLCRKITGIGAVPLLASVVLERILDIFVVVFMLGAAILVGSPDSGYLMTAGYSLLAVALLALLVVSLYCYRGDSARFITAKLTFFLPQRWQISISEHLSHGVLVLEALRSPRLLLNLVLLSIVMWSMMALCIHLAVAAFGIEASWTAAVVTMVLLIAGVSLPTSPGLVGTVQICFVLGLKPYGIDAADAIAASIVFQVCVILPVVCAGIFYVWRSSAWPRRRFAGTRKIE